MKPKTKPTPPAEQRQDLLDSERQANAQQPRNFKDDALDDKVVSVAPDGTGPTSTGTFDPKADRKAGSGSPGAAQGPGRVQQVGDKQRGKQSDHQADGPRRNAG